MKVLWAALVVALLAGMWAGLAQVPCPFPSLPHLYPLPPFHPWVPSADLSPLEGRPR